MEDNKNIHVLPTDKPSRFWMTKLGNLTRCHDIKPIKKALGNNVNISITSDEEIKKGNYFYSLFQGEERILKYNKFVIPFPKDKKIILTTDQDLIKDGVQAIDDEFLEWFVKNPSCESVEVLRCPIEGLYTIIPKKKLNKKHLKKLLKEFFLCLKQIIFLIFLYKKEMDLFKVLNGNKKEVIVRSKLK